MYFNRVIVLAGHIINIVHFSSFLYGEKIE